MVDEHSPDILTRLRLVAVHAIAVPASAVLFVGVSVLLAPLARRRALDVSLDDTMYVVAHFHPTVFLAVFLAVCTAVLRETNGPKTWLWVAWGNAGLHLATAVLMPSVWLTTSSGEVYVFVTSVSAWQRMLGYAFLVTAVLAGISGLIALAVSAVAGLRATRTTSQRRGQFPCRGIGH
jgi:hypothetical protein